MNPPDCGDGLSTCVVRILDVIAQQGLPVRAQGRHAEGQLCRVHAVERPVGRKLRTA